MATRTIPQKPSAMPRPGSAGATGGATEETASKTDVTKPPSCPAAAKKYKKKKKPQPAYENPAFSIPLKELPENPLLIHPELQNVMRRNKPKGEKTKAIQKLVDDLKGADISVAEFLGLVAPLTGDNGAGLRSVLTDEMNSFRSMARKIYDTMMKDVSDVMTNQHIQLREFEQERTTLFTEKMMRAINEIFSLAPSFDFEMYYENKEAYLSSLFPIPKLIKADSEEAAMHRRQQAFHRLNWLKMEGDRLAAENQRLQDRLKDLKKEQMMEIGRAERKGAQAEAQREELEAQETATQRKLDSLAKKMGKTMVDTEAAIRMATDEANMTAPVAKGSKGSVKRRPKKRPEWVSDVAADIDEKSVEERMFADARQADSPSVAGAVKRVRSQAGRSRTQTPERRSAQRKEKTPPRAATPPKERSPFHYSPPKTPPEVRFEQKMAELNVTRYRKETMTMRQRGPQPTNLLVPPGGAGGLTPSGTTFGGAAEGVTPTYQTLQAATPGAPSRQGTAAKQRPAHSKFQLEEPAQRRGRAMAPRDTWGGFG